MPLTKTISRGKVGTRDFSACKMIVPKTSVPVTSIYCIQFSLFVQFQACVAQFRTSTSSEIPFRFWHWWIARFSNTCQEHRASSALLGARISEAYDVQNMVNIVGVGYILFCRNLAVGTVQHERNTNEHTACCFSCRILILYTTDFWKVRIRLVAWAKGLRLVHNVDPWVGHQCTRLGRNLCYLTRSNGIPIGID